ncbi:MAG: hypothetical protein AB7S26_12295 [Sandaracinaceae bacterium]
MALRLRFGAAADASVRAAARNAGSPIASGWSHVDAALGGGLRPGETLSIEGNAGAGSLALASEWARACSAAGEPVMVLDPLATSLPHAWVEPDEGRAPIWRLGVGVAFGTEDELWPAFDIALRSGAFGLIVVLDAPTAPRTVGARVARLAAERGARLIVTHGHERPAPWAPTYRVRLYAGLVRWVDGPLGARPAARQVEGNIVDRERTAESRTSSSFARELDARTTTDRLRPTPRAPDRRPPSGRGGRTRR